MIKYCESIYQTKRWKTREVMIGNIGVGGNNPIRIQSMTTSNTRDIEATIDQIIRLADAGCEIALIHTHKLEKILDATQEDALTISGIQGNPNEIIGDILMIQNNYTLGLTEENILSSMRSFITKIISEETNARHQIKRSDSADLKDKVSRAFGILIHSYQIEAIEALNALSLLKLGLEANWISGIDMQKLNELFFTTRRSHLLYDSKEKINQEEIPHKRAEKIHRALKDVKLLIE